MSHVLPPVLELADSEVAAVVAEAPGVLTVRLSVGHVTCAGEVAGFVRGLTLRLEGVAAPVAVDAGCLGRLRSARVVTSAGPRRALALDADLAGPLTLELEFGNGSAGRWAGCRLVVEGGAGATVIPSYAC